MIIIIQYGRIAIHSSGQRSEYAKIDSLFSIRESDAIGSIEFINRVKLFNKHIEDIAKVYECKVITWQDFIESLSSAQS